MADVDTIPPLSHGIGRVCDAAKILRWWGWVGVWREVESSPGIWLISGNACAPLGAAAYGQPWRAPCNDNVRVYAWW